MRLAFFGDVVGKSGRDGLSDHLPGLKRDLKLDFVVVNAENAAGGFGITENTANDIFNAIEDLPVPTLSAIKGHALGGGCETILSTDFRLADTTAKIGLPETKLGIMPGFGGTVRLPRVIGADNALEWITTGKDYRADDALKVGAVDAVVAPEALHSAAVQMMKDAIAGKLNWSSNLGHRLRFTPPTFPSRPATGSRCSCEAC